MTNYYYGSTESHPTVYDVEAAKLEAVTTCVGFDDLLDATLSRNHAQLDHLIVVTSHEDRATAAVARKHGATLVMTDLFKKNGRAFNKGAAINAGFDYFQWHGWRMHLDCDILLPDSFRRMLLNHSHLERDCLYGADRVDVVGNDAIARLLAGRETQHQHGLLLGASIGRLGEASLPLSHRLVCNLRGYLPLGFFQLYHASRQKPYPYSLGTAAHDDMMFSALWPEGRRRHLASMICYHLCPTAPFIGEHWDGKTRKTRLDARQRIPTD